MTRDLHQVDKVPSASDSCFLSLAAPPHVLSSAAFLSNQLGLSGVLPGSVRNRARAAVSILFLWDPGQDLLPV